MHLPVISGAKKQLRGVTHSYAGDPTAKYEKLLKNTC
jgi:hypothetical protein